MRFTPVLAAAILALVPRVACADCLGFFNEPEKGFKLKPGGHLERTDETVAAGTTLKFKGIGSLHNKSYLTRSQSDIVYDAQNIELTAGCDLPNVDLSKR